MARLVSWPAGIGFISIEVLSGPRSIGAGSSESVTGYAQTVSSPYGLWKLSFGLPPLRGMALRRWRGTIAALKAANGLRLTLSDPDGLGWSAIGVTASRATIRDGLTWSNGRSWAEGTRWRLGRPLAPVLAAAAKGATLVRLGGLWGDKLDVGDRFGFVGIYGAHEVTERIEDGLVRVWPPLRTALTLADRASLTPVMAMRLVDEDGANLPRGVSHGEGMTVTLLEIEHQDVIDWFGG